MDGRTATVAAAVTAVTIIALVKGVPPIERIDCNMIYTIRLDFKGSRL